MTLLVKPQITQPIAGLPLAKAPAPGDSPSRHRERQCQQCGKSFSARQDRKYCSRECAYSASRRRVEKQCLWCRERFSVRIQAAAQKYCSSKCMGLAKRTRVERPCACCGRNLVVIPSQTARGGGKFCSRKCSRHNREKSCPHCGKSFTAQRPKQKFCSLECGCSARRKPVEFEKQCQQCGKSFTAHQQKQKYCSRKCIGLAHRTRVEKQCAWCGRGFTVRLNSVARYCSDECRCLASRTRVERQCAWCGCDFMSFPSRAARGGGKYCSLECRGLAKRTLVKKQCVQCGRGGDVPADVEKGGAALLALSQ
jgi:hypothetical protein